VKKKKLARKGRGEKHFDRNHLSSEKGKRENGASRLGVDYRGGREGGGEGDY